MGKKLPNIYHDLSKVKSSNKKAYYSFKNKSTEENNINSKKETIISNNFFSYFNKVVSIYLKDGSFIRCKILSKNGDKILIDSGEYLSISDISSIE